MSSMMLVDRHVSLFNGSVRTFLRRESDRRRHAHSPFGWLFQPYMGEEMVALACHQGAGDVVTLAALPFTRQRLKISEAQVVTLLPAANTDTDNSLIAATQRRHGLLHSPQRSLVCDEKSLEALVCDVGNRPLIGWSLPGQLRIFNKALHTHLGFTLPNAQIDLARHYQRILRRRQPHLEAPKQLSTAARHWRIPLSDLNSVLDQAMASALLYLKLQRLTP
ncbi:DNA polymerase III subunit epsilon [Vreelandella aquamarina]